MKRPAPASWSITARLVLVAAVPSFIMFVVVSAALYITGQGDARTAIRERGQLMASALAESSRYAIVSGNVASLDRSYGHLLAADRSVVGIEVLDAKRKMLLSAGLPPASSANTFEAAVDLDVADIDTFGAGSQPHIATPPSAPAQFSARPPLGYVRVTMSPAPLVAAMRDRLVWSMGIVGVAMMLSVCMGLFLAQQMRAPLTGILSALRRIRTGETDVPTGPPARGELGELQHAVGEAAKSVVARRAELEQAVAERTGELQEAMRETQLADAERRRLIASGNRLIEDERRRIAAEIHDHLNASLIVVRMQAQMISDITADLGGPEGAADIARLAKRIDEEADGLYVAARSIVRQLRPEVLETLGLLGAIEEMVRNYNEMQADCMFRLETALNFPELPQDSAIAAYRLVQEALSNVVKHAAAGHATVRLTVDQVAGCVRITVQDDGKGFDSKVVAGDGVGLIGMRERAWAAGGSLHIAAAPSDGTVVVIHLPFQR